VLVLALDTSSPSGSIAIFQDGKVISSISAWTGEIYSSRMFRQLESVMADLSLTFVNFDIFAVAVGPGSFTGLRVGLAAVKAWSEVYRKPIAAVSALEAVASQSVSRASILVPVLDARRSQVYYGIYKRAAVAPASSAPELEADELVSTPDEFFEHLALRKEPSAMAIVTPVPELLSSALSRYETTRPGSPRFHIEQVSPILAPHIARLGALHAKCGKLVDSLTLDANYIRRSDAELHWKAPAGS
jgi:tRNA threonylcarbamoyladenosine biosynthesis protein TsaB